MKKYKFVFYITFNGFYKNSPASIARRIWINDFINKFNKVFSWTEYSFK